MGFLAIRVRCCCRLCRSSFAHFEGFMLGRLGLNWGSVVWGVFISCFSWLFLLSCTLFLLLLSLIHHLIQLSLLSSSMLSSCPLPFWLLFYHNCLLVPCTSISLYCLCLVSSYHLPRPNRWKSSPIWSIPFCSDPGTSPPFEDFPRTTWDLCI